MADHPAYNLAMVFEKTSGWHFKTISITGGMLQLLFLIDGQRSMAQICETLQLTYEALFRDLQRLHELHLVKLAAARTPAGKEALKGLAVKKGWFRGACFEVAAIDPRSVAADQG